MEVKCVLPGQACTAQSQGTPFVDPTGKAKRGTVADLYSSTSYDCYVIADQKVVKKEKCSKPVRITTLGLPTFVFTSSVTNIIGRKLMQGPVISTDRCFVGSNGNFTSCVSSGLVDTFIVDGVVSPQKQWLSFSGFTLAGNAVTYKNITTCPLGPFGRTFLPRCDVSYTAPTGYEFITTAFDPLGRRVWFSLTPAPGRRSLPTSGGTVRESLSNTLPMNNLVQRMKERQGKNSVVATIQTAPDDYFGTCAIDAQGVYSSCTQSAPVPYANLVGPGQDTSGFYATNSTTGALQFCPNDMSDCSSVSGVSPFLEVFQLRFLTNTQAYLTAYNITSNYYVTLRCDVVNPTTFSNCQTVFDDPYDIVLLLNPANNGANAYTFAVDFFNSKISYEVCSVAPSTGFFENCTAISDALPFFITSPAFSSPITF